MAGLDGNVSDGVTSLDNVAEADLNWNGNRTIWQSICRAGQLLDWTICSQIYLIPKCSL